MEGLKELLESFVSLFGSNRYVQALVIVLMSLAGAKLVDWVICSDTTRGRVGDLTNLVRSQP